MNTKSVSVCRLFLMGLGFLGSSLSGAEVNDKLCGPVWVTDSYGPFDYRTVKDVRLKRVEDWHLTPQIIALDRGTSTASVGDNLDYTLRAFPNHSVALMAMVRLGEKEKTNKPNGARYIVECYFQRALRFSENDTAVRVIYASYLSKVGKRAEALSQLNAAAQLEGENANINYNMGLIYFDLKEYDKALSYAHRAYRGGFTLPGLRDKLKRAGKWREPNAQDGGGG